MVIVAVVYRIAYGTDRREVVRGVERDVCSQLIVSLIVAYLGIGCHVVHHITVITCVTAVET